MHQAIHQRRPYTSAVAGAIPLQNREAKSSWKGYAAFLVIDDSKGLRLRVSPTYTPLTVTDHALRQHRSTPAVLSPEWWGSTVRDEHNTELPVSTWCASLKDAITEAATSHYRGVDVKHKSWEDHWWVVWELTLWSDTITGLVNANSISPTVISIEERKSLEPSTIKAWNISRPLDMTAIGGRHHPYRVDGAGYIGAGCADYIGKCEKHIVKKKCVWRDVAVRENTRLTLGKCSREGCAYEGHEVDIISGGEFGLCSRCFNEIQGRYTHETESDQSDAMQDDEVSSAAAQGMH